MGRGGKLGLEWNEGFGEDRGDFFHLAAGCGWDWFQNSFDLMF